MDTYTCNKCKVEKPFAEFPKHFRSRLGISYTCKECARQYQQMKNLAKDRVKLRGILDEARFEVATRMLREDPELMKRLVRMDHHKYERLLREVQAKKAERFWNRKKNLLARPQNDPAFVSGRSRVGNRLVAEDNADVYRADQQRAS